jgi:hypothetical protein
MPEGLDQAPAAGVSVGSAPHPPAGSRGTGEVGVPGTAGGEACPLCGAPLHPEQEWCLRCGAAARTRLAASSSWKAPIIALAVVATLSLGVLAAALVKLAMDSSSTTNVTRTIAGAPASVTSPGTAAPTPAPGATTPGATTPGAATPGAAAPRAGATTPGAATPGAGAPGAAAPGAVGLAPVTSLTSTAATLNGAVNPQGVPTTYQFQYGPTTSYVGRAPGTPVVVGAGASAVAVNSKVANLTPRTTYHYKLTASKAGRAVSTPDATFTTPG